MMRKNTWGVNKTAKRTLALILSATMILGSTITVFASEEGEGGQDPAPVLTNEEKVEAVTEAEGVAGEASTAIEAAGTQIAAFEIQDVIDNLNTADELINGVHGSQDTPDGLPIADDVKEMDGVVDNLGDAKAAMGQAVAADAISQQDVATVNAYVQGLNGQAAGAAAAESADEAIADAGTANTSDDRDEAYAAADSARSNLATAEQAFTNAQSQFNAAQSALNDANTKQAEAQRQVNLAEAALKDAKMNSTAALAQLNAAKARVDAIEKQKESLEKMQNQYYAMMVQYYRVLAGNDADKAKTEKNNGLDWNDDGSLNIEGCADNFTADQINRRAEKITKKNEAGKDEVVDGFKGPDTSVSMLGRGLLKQLVTFMIENDENVDPKTANIQFAVVPKGKKANADMMEAGEDTVFENSKKHDQVVNFNNEPYKSQKEGIYKLSSNQSDGGRTNRFEVTYTDKTGETKTVAYNYIFKSSKYGDELDLEKGIVYLAEIKQGQDGKWTAERVIDPNNYDDWQKLTGAVSALEDFEKAQKAVNDAQALVAELDAKVQALQNVNLTSLNELEALQAQLNTAKSQLDAAEARVEEARRAVAGIDLSRFDVTVSGGTTATTGGTTIPMITSPLTITPVGTLTTAFTGTTGAAVAADGTGEATTIGDGTLPGAAAPEGTTLEDPELPGAATAGTTLDDPELPGAQGVEEGVNLWWLWLLIVLALATGYGIYKYNEKKKEQENINKAA